MSKRDRKNGVPETVTSIPLVDPHALSDNPSIGELVRDATTQVSTLVRAEVELARAEITRDVKKGLTGSVFFIAAGLVALYSTFFLFFFLAELLDTWLWRWAAFLIVFLLMVAAAALFAFLGYRKVRRIRGPQQTIESVKETTAALTPGLQKFAGGGPSAPSASTATPAAQPAPPVAPKPRPAVASAPVATPVRQSAPAPAPRPVVVATEVREEPTATAEEPEVQYDTAAYAEQTAAYADDAAYYEPAARSADVPYADDETEVVIERTVVYADNTTVYYDEPTGPIPPIPGGVDDPTAAIYADTGMPITPEHEQRPGDPSGS